MRNTVKCPKFTSSTYNLYFLCNFCRNTCFFRDHWWRAICSNTYSTGPVYSHLVQYSNERVENIIGCYGIDYYRHQSQELPVTDKVLSTPRMNMASCAMPEMSVLSSSATENITNDLTFFFSWLSKFAEMSETLSATVFLVRLILAKTSASQNTRFQQPLGCRSSRSHPHSMALMLTLCH